MKGEEGVMENGPQHNKRNRKMRAHRGGCEEKGPKKEPAKRTTRRVASSRMREDEWGRAKIGRQRDSGDGMRTDEDHECANG